MADNYQLPAWIAQSGIALIAAMALLAAVAAGVVRRRAGHALRLPPDQPGTLMAARGVRKSYRGRAVLAGVDLTVRPGEVVGVLGPNGAGKSTLMKIATRLVCADAGTVRTEPGIGSVGAAIERPGMLPHLSGRDNLRLAWQATGRPEAEGQLAEVIAASGLSDAELDRRAGDYSQGTGQRLALGLAMLGMPKLLILDEPTNGLDPVQIEHQREVLRAYVGSGRAVVISTHLLDEAARVCTRVVVVREGRVVGELPPESLDGPHDQVVSELTAFYRHATTEADS